MLVLCGAFVGGATSGSVEPPEPPLRVSSSVLVSTDTDGLSVSSGVCADVSGSLLPVGVSGLLEAVESEPEPVVPDEVPVSVDPLCEDPSESDGWASTGAAVKPPISRPSEITPAAAKRAARAPP